MIKNHLTRRTIAIFFILNFLSTIIPYNAIYANNNGPNAPEASGFEPVSATDMVNLSSGDMAYVLPLLEIDGFPVTLSYHAGIPMDMDASWTGLGWNINTGSISRGVVSTPDDWNGGKSMKFTYYYYETETYTVNVGVGFGKAAEVGVGLSWGSNKSLSGSVSASVGPISASIDTDGNYSVGLNSSALTEGLGFKDAFAAAGDDEGSPFGGSLSVSGNVSGGGLSVGINAGYSSNGLNAGLGVSISGNGIGAGYSIGGGNGESGGSKRSAGSGGSIGSFSSGDMSISSSGFYIPISIGIFSFGFGYQKQKIKYAKGLNRYGFGTLYQAENTFATENDLFNLELGEKKDPFNYSNTFNDLQRRNYYGDIYDQELPQSETEFINDYREAIEKVNFTYAGYDTYGVNASGISGNMTPLIGENIALIGEGMEGKDSSVEDKRMKVFYHNSMERSRRSGTHPQLATRKNLNSNNFHFAFDGQITEDVNVSGRINTSTSKTAGFNLSDFASKVNNYRQRPKTGSYVEVYTNNQLDNDPSKMLMPKSIYNDGGNLLGRTQDLGYVADGIGGYKVTAPDGKTYHFGQPVYQYEEIEHFYVELEDADNKDLKNSTTKRSATPYATHWLLTAITGPDFIDNGNNYPDEDDLGYWLRLDHGQWSNAYTWRTPYADKSMLGGIDNSITANRNYRTYSTFNEDNIDKSDAGHFMQGRKDLYYLDKIVSRNQIAYFVKDVRLDATGTDLDYDFRNLRNATVHNTFKEEQIEPEEYVQYDKEYSLRLDRIILTKNEGKDSYINEDTSASISSSITAISKPNRYLSYGFFNQQNYLPTASKTHHLHQSNQIIDVNDIDNFDYSKALKVIKFKYNYNLAKNSPNSNATTKGRLTLERVKTFGRGMVKNAKENQLYDYMPPYKFNYKKGIQSDGSEVVFESNNAPKKIGDELIKNKKDSWGFIEGKGNDGKTLADSWSLNKIETPQGGVIDIEYEEDDYYVEAFSRRYWDNYLNFKPIVVGDNLEIEITNDNDKEDIDFTKYFNKEDEVYFDFWAEFTQKFRNITVRHGRSNLNIETKKVKIKELSSSKVVLEIPNYDYIYTPTSNHPFHFMNHGITLSNRQKIIHYQSPFPIIFDNYDAPRGSEMPFGSSTTRRFNLKYKLLATKSPEGNSGGGLKVSKITVNDEAGAKYETTYEYNVPNLNTNQLTNRSSGITSYYPVYGTTFVPYQNELPGPGVMYEWVTMKARGYSASGIELPSESTRYHYYTLQPNFDIFDPNFTMKDNDGDVLFQALVENKTINSTSNIEAKDIKIKKNLAKIGQLISIEKFNSFGHLMNKTTNQYTNKLATFKETFTSMKSVYNHDEDDGTFSNGKLKSRLLSISSKEEGNKVLQKVTSVTPFGTSSIEYSSPDQYLGTYRASERKMSDGTRVKTTKFPAYEVYEEMGSKVEDVKNKNMLTQEAMNITSVKTLKGWRTTNASITTWNNDKWIYRDESGNEPLASSEVPVWRKHKNYVWKGALDENGTYGKELRTTDFKWGYGATQTNTEWQEISEITRYNHYSLPLETKDINNNYASSKMGDNWKKVIAGGNARYTEMYYSGLEYANEGGLIEFEGELTFESCKPTNTAHTGNRGVALTSVSSKAFIINATVGTAKTNEFREGKYKASVWVKKHPELGFEPVKLVVNGNEFESTEIVEAGDWALLNFYVNFTNGNLNTYLKKVRGSVTLDDFRIHPIASSMNSYVYDKNTDELRYILDGNNLATEFRYDKAGRLCRTYKEVVDQGTNLGGFKKINEYRYRYQNAPSSSGECSCCE